MYWNRTDKFFCGEGTTQTYKGFPRPAYFIYDTIQYQLRYGDRVYHKFCRAGREEFLVKIIFGNGNSSFRLKKLASQKLDEESIIFTQSYHVSPTLYWQIIDKKRVSFIK